ncbi:hypothetical protein G6F22_017603 [Rhizopus arrhizus]|nr:hypothetical protein G6F22_017603 [Rhizopus arrhizus]
MESEPPDILASYSLHSFTMSTPISFGPSEASSQALPTVPKIARAGIKAEAHGGGPSDQQANHANDDREDNLGEAIAIHAPEELRSDTVAKTEEEEQEEHLLQNRGDGDVELTDQYAHQQSTRYCA